MSIIMVLCACKCSKRVGNQLLALKKCRVLGCEAMWLQLLVNAYVVPGSLILSALMMGAIRCSETSVLTRATRRHIPESGIFHSQCRGTVKSYKC
jgi:hypothetical protein